MEGSGSKYTSKSMSGIATAAVLPIYHFTTHALGSFNGITTALAASTRNLLASPFTNAHAVAAQPAGSSPYCFSNSCEISWMLLDSSTCSAEDTREASCFSKKQTSWSNAEPGLGVGTKQSNNTNVSEWFWRLPIFGECVYLELAEANGLEACCI